MEMLLSFINRLQKTPDMQLKLFLSFTRTKYPIAAPLRSKCELHFDPPSASDGRTPSPLNWMLCVIVR